VKIRTDADADESRKPTDWSVLFFFVSAGTYFVTGSVVLVSI
jgi:hypothetical protein